MCSDPAMTSAAAPRLSRAQAQSSSFPRIENSSSEPCALTVNGMPAAAPTGAPRRTWFVRRKSAGRCSRTAAAFRSTKCSRSAAVKSWR